MALRQLPCLFLFLTFCFSISHSVRFGSRAKTIFFPPGSNQQKESFTRLRKSTDSVREADVVTRQKRQSGNGLDDNTGPTNVDVTKFDLHDSHPELLVHWVGEGRDEIICLTRDITLTATSNSSVHISYDYGQSFVRKYLQYPSGQPAVFDRFYHSSASVTRYIFNDVTNNAVWVTTNVGVSFTHYNVSFRPAVISMHESAENIVLAMDDQDEDKKLWLSENFGATWRVVQRDVKSFFWGVEGFDKPQALYVEREEPGGLGSVLRSEDYFEDFLYEIIITGVKDFEVRSDYLFATKPHESGEEDMLDLWVSHKREEFVKAHFPTELVTKGFYIADASEEQVFVCVNHNKVNSHLYISEAGGFEFSLSLEGVVYFSPEGPGKDSWLSQYADEPFADLYKVQGLRGIYIASQFVDVEGDFDESNMVSLITFDKGGEWRQLVPPENDHSGQPITCEGNCSLHLSQKVGRYRPGSRLIPMVSKKSAPGIILGTGIVGGNLDTTLSEDYSIFLSRTAGATWLEVLIGHYFFTFGDHGGVITAVKEYGATNEVEYTINEGQTWYKDIFNSEEIYVYGLMTEPGEKSTTVTIFGSEVSKHSWMVIQVDTRRVLGQNCETADYKEWWPGEDIPDVKCLLGRKMIYERREPNSVCYNGRDYDRPIRVENCTCSREDYECDEGYMELDYTKEVCIKDKQDMTDPGAVPDVCPEGQLYRRSKGYRKVEGDTCVGNNTNYEAEQVACPISRNPEFLLYSQRTEMHRYLLASEHDEQLPIQNRRLIASVDYDVDNNCYYYADTVDDVIMKFCQDDSGQEETILVSNDIEMVEGLAFDWLALNIYWLDSSLDKIEVAKHDGRLRRTLVSNTNELDQPRGLALDPKKGYMYWADWGNTPKLVRAYMDGTHIETIVDTNVHWPNGITIDEQTGRVYWTDAYYHRIESSFSDGSSRYVIVSGDLPHPFALGIYKDRVYWDDWSTLNIESANKHDGSDRQVVLRGLEGIMDLKIFHNSSQQGINPCSHSGSCSQLCLVLPNTTNVEHPVVHHCLCADDFDKETNPDGSEVCVCPNGGGLLPNGTCSSHGASCAESQFACAQGGYCIPEYWRCDGDFDCAGGSDERDCSDTGGCPSDQFSCTNLHCIPLEWRCDHDDDCHDYSDEEDCQYPSCEVSQFTCDNHRCIPGSWHCDLDNDCGDMSDERNCTHITTTLNPSSTCESSLFTCDNRHCIPSPWECDGYDDCGDNSDEMSCSTSNSCTTYQFPCASGRCIPTWWHCDSYDDCGDNSDEENCPLTTDYPYYTSYPSSCTAPQFVCFDGSFCVPPSWKCDNIEDCNDGSDEYDCDLVTILPTSCTTWQFTCDDGNCIPGYWACDDYDDCGDGSDERSCSTGFPYYTTMASSLNCPPYKEPCAAGESPPCIFSWWVCDGEADCSGGSDERSCPGFTESPPHLTTRRPCTSAEFRCTDSRRCIPQSYHCNGYMDCSDGSDEHNCGTTRPRYTTPSPCPVNNFQCRIFYQCFDDLLVCDGIPSCIDGTDEDNCDGTYTVTSFSASQLTEHSVEVRWSIGSHHPSQYTYKLYMRDVSFAHYPAALTTIAGQQQYSLTWPNLLPGRTYEFTIAVLTSTTEYQKTPQVSVTLHNDQLPSVPRNVQVLPYQVGNDVYGVNITWETPASQNPFSDILRYEIYYMITGGIDAEISIVDGSRHSKAFPSLLPNHEYQFKVRAVNNVGEGPYSDTKSVYVGGSSDIQDPPEGLMTSFIDVHSLLLQWEVLSRPVRVDGYVVFYSISGDIEGDMELGRTPKREATEFYAHNLCEGTSYVFTVAGVSRNKTGPKATPYVPATTKGRPYSPPVNLTGSAVSTSKVNLKWDPVPNDRRSFTYNVFFGQSLARLSLSGMTNDTEYSVSGLIGGIQYYFSVQAVDLLHMQCHSNLSKPVLVSTTYDENAKPRDFQMIGTYMAEKTVGVARIALSWRSPRDVPRQLGYVVHYHLNGTDGVKHNLSKVAETSNTTINYNLTSLLTGASYVIYVTTTSKQAMSSNTIVVTAATYSAPQTLKHYRDIDKPTVVTLIWDSSPNKLAHDLGFAVFMLNVSKTRPANATSKVDFDELKVENSLWMNIANTTNMSYDVKDLLPNRLYGFAVSVGYYKGHHGQFSAKEFVNFTFDSAPNPKPDPKPHSGDQGFQVWVLVSIAGVTVLVTLLAAALVYFVVRHQRLQRSFMSFANSHYDTRSGTATFNPEENTTDLGSEEEDQPIIRGFSDDEPLVVA